MKKSDEKRRRRSQSEEADWSSQDAGTIAELIHNITATGGAVRFGTSRDGGAYSLGIFGDGKPFTEFCPANTDVDAWLQGFILDYEE